MNLYMIATSFKSPPNKFGCQARAQGEAACNLIGEFVEGSPASRSNDKKHRLPTREQPVQKPRSLACPRPRGDFSITIHNRSRRPIDSRRLDQVGCRQVFWLPALETLFQGLILLLRLPILTTHQDSGILQHSSPVTAARPRPIFTAFPFKP